MILIFVCEVLDLHPILRQFSQLEKALFKLTRFLGILLNLLIFLLVHDLVLQPAFHYSFPDLFNTLNEQLFKFVLLAHFVDAFETGLLGLLALFIEQNLQITDGLVVVGLNNLEILDDLFLYIFLAHV